MSLLALAGALQTSAFSRLGPPAALGDLLDSVDTPALVLDLDAFEANLTALHSQAAAGGLAVRAHGKAHRCPDLALRQVAAGASGICVQKVGEAEGFAAAGLTDILISNEIIDPAKLSRLAALAMRPRMRLAVCVDDPSQVDRLRDACAKAGAANPGEAHAGEARAGEAHSRAPTAQAIDAEGAPDKGGARIDVMIEIDVGQERCGVTSIEQALAIADRIASATPWLKLRGLQAYQGRAQHVRDPARRAAAVAQAAAIAREYRAALEQAGHPVSEISGGGTGSFPNEIGAGVWTEIQAGSYALLDLDYRTNLPDPAAPQLRQAIGVLATVISRRDSHAVLDVGLKSVSVDSGLPQMRAPHWRVRGLSDEHTVVEPLTGAAPLSLGERVLLDPGHCDPTVSMHDWIVAYRGDRVEAVWPVLPRSASR